MLQPHFLLQQHPREAGRLRLTDTTPAYHPVTAPGGYGPPHTTREAVAYVVFRLRDSAGGWFQTPPLDWQPTAPLELRASDFSPYRPGDADATDADGCHYPSEFRLADGEHELTYEVYAYAGVPTTVYHYHLATSLCEGDGVWVRQGGAWVDATAWGTLSPRREWEWVLEGSTDYIDDYEIRRPLPEGGYKTVSRGSVQRLVAADGPLSVTVLPARVGARTERILLTGEVRAAIAALARLPLPELTRTVGGCEPLTELAIARASLDALLADGAVDGAAGRLAHIRRAVDLLTRCLL